MRRICFRRSRCCSKIRARRHACHSAWSCAVTTGRPVATACVPSNQSSYKSPFQHLAAFCVRHDDPRRCQKSKLYGLWLSKAPAGRRSTSCRDLPSSYASCARIGPFYRKEKWQVRAFYAPRARIWSEHSGKRSSTKLLRPPRSSLPRARTCHQIPEGAASFAKFGLPTGPHLYNSESSPRNAGKAFGRLLGGALA